MDEYTGKRAVGVVGVSRRGSRLSFKDTSENEDQSVKCCNRLGCSTRLNSKKGSQVGTSGKTDYSKTSFRSASGKAIIGSSSKTCSAESDPRKSHQETAKLSHEEMVPAKTSYVQGETEAPELISSEVAVESRFPENKNSKTRVVREFSADTSEEVGSYNAASNTRPQRQIYQKCGISKPDAMGSSVRRSFSSRNSNQLVNFASHGQGANASRYGLRNLGCTSVSDVLPSGFSSSDSSGSQRNNMVKKRSPNEESSRGKNLCRSSPGGNSGTSSISLSNTSLSTFERLSSQTASRRTRYQPSREDATSVRTRRTINGDSKAKLSDHVNGNSITSPEPPVMIPQLPETEMSTSETTRPSSSRQFPVEVPTICPIPCVRPGSSSENIRNRPIAHPEVGITRPFPGFSMDRRRFNVDGIAEVLLALERIEQDEELTYEQLLVLESNLFLGGVSFYDQHRDMRLDIDNMSYEELLALEEKMGTVSTALTEEALTKCLKTSRYMHTSPYADSMGCGDDDIKCSICQEEYVPGEEVGKLECEHRYHVTCIHQWLRQKNWCAICKASATPS